MKYTIRRVNFDSPDFFDHINENHNIVIYDFNSFDFNFRVDLIVLSYNGLKTSKRFLKHFLDHYPKENFCRLIWVDNGSSDGTPEYIKKVFGRLGSSCLVSCEDNLGVIEGRNLGLYVSSRTNSKSNYLMFLDNDQFVYDDWLDHHLWVLNSSNVDLVGVEAWQLTNALMPLRKIENTKEHYNYVGCGGMVMKRQIYETIGPFDLRYSPAYFEDPDFCFRCVNGGFKIGWNYKAKIIHMPHQTLGAINQQKKHDRLVRSLHKFREKWRGKKMPMLRQKNLELFRSN